MSSDVVGVSDVTRDSVTFSLLGIQNQLWHNEQLLVNTKVRVVFSLNPRIASPAPPHTSVHR